MRCKRCEKFYDTHPLIQTDDGQVHDLGDGVLSDPVKCAFESGTFNSDNWCCETMGVLRHFIEDHTNWSLDHNIGVIPCPYPDCGSDKFWSHLVMYWYKNRGRTDEALLFGGDNPRPLTLEIAEQLIKFLLVNDLII